MLGDSRRASQMYQQNFYASWERVRNCARVLLHKTLKTWSGHSGRRRRKWVEMSIKQRSVFKLIFSYGIFSNKPNGESKGL